MKISVCLATYNGGKYIKEQLGSILPQLSEDDEVIISDDGSTDNTLKIIKDFNDERVKIFMNNLGRGYSRNFENAINHSSGEIIFLSDQDDVWMNDKVIKMVSALEDSDLVISDALISDENLNPTLGSHFIIHKVKQGFLNNWIKTRYIGACMAFKKRMLNKILPFPKYQQYCAHDYWITNIGEFFYKVSIIHEPLIKYRRHGNNASSGGEMSTNSILHKVIVRLYTMQEILKRI